MSINLATEIRTLDAKIEIAWSEYSERSIDYEPRTRPVLRISAMVAPMQGTPVKIGPFRNRQMMVDMMVFYQRQARAVTFTVEIEEGKA